MCPSMLPNAARYQLRYTPIVIKLWSCKWSNLWSNTFLTAIFCFPNRPKSARLKGFLRFLISGGASTVYAPKPPALPTAPHPVVLCFLVCFLLIGFLLSVRGASLRNIVAALCPTEGQTPQKPFKFTRDILPFLARFVNLKAMRLRSFRQVLRFIPLKMLFVPFLIFFLISVL